MKHACLFHGTGGSPDHFWQPYVKNELEKLGYSIWSPQLPETNNPQLDKWLPFVLKNGIYNNSSVLVGHSSGCPLILSLLEKIERKIKMVILVSRFIEDDSGVGMNPILQANYDWEKIKGSCEKFVIINSDNDPWGCNDHAGRKIFEKVGGEFIIRHGEGHMGSERFNQPYKEFPLIVKLIEAFDN